eukprot:scaffold53066_cov33-Tisochrysis_lutea.AAC.3
MARERHHARATAALTPRRPRAFSRVQVQAMRGSAAGGWTLDAEALVGHEGSVEDVCWSPVEAGVLMSCGCDSTVRVWDVRKRSAAAITVRSSVRISGPVWKHPLQLFSRKEVAPS